MAINDGLKDVWLQQSSFEKCSSCNKTKHDRNRFRDIDYQHIRPEHVREASGDYEMYHMANMGTGKKKYISVKPA